MHEFRVTKYDPAKRSRDGTYLDQQEWTCANEMGKSFDGQALTPDYLNTEARYLRAVSRFFEASGLSHLRVTCLEARSKTISALEDIKRDQPYLCEPGFTLADYREDQAVGAAEIPLLGKLNLRGILECKLEFDGKFFVHFGFDYYMYIGCQPDCMSAVSETGADNLYVEMFTSPHRRPDGFNAPAKIQVSDKILDMVTIDNESVPVVGSEIVLADAQLTELKRMFGMSEEHPFFGYFDIDEAVAARLNAAFGLILNIDRCSYTLDTTDY